MHSQVVSVPEIKLVGISVRTCNRDEMLPEKCQIAGTVKHYFQENLAEKIQNRHQPGVTYAVYTDYETDHDGEYTYFLGEAVDDFSQLPDGFETLTIMPGSYAKFTTEPGQMPAVVFNAWQSIWQMDVTNFGSPRQYLTDFEVHDDRTADLNNAIVDIYIGTR